LAPSPNYRKGASKGEIERKRRTREEEEKEEGDEEAEAGSCHRPTIRDNM
jgi:hypothetical protein